MKIQFEEIVARKEWLHTEILNTLPGDVITKASEDQFFEVKIVVNGVELEPNYFNDIMNNLDRYITKEANNILKEKLLDAQYKIQKLNDIFEQAKDKIIDEFDLDSEL